MSGSWRECGVIINRCSVPCHLARCSPWSWEMSPRILNVERDFTMFTTFTLRETFEIALLQRRFTLAGDIKLHRAKV